MIWSQCCTSSGRFIWFFAMDPVAIWQMMQSNILLEQPFCLFCAVKILNEGLTKGQVAWRELDQVCNGASWNWANDIEKHCAGTTFPYFGQWKYRMKVLPKGKLPEEDLRETLYQLRKVYLIFCNGSWWNLANDALQEQHFLPLLGSENSE